MTSICCGAFRELLVLTWRSKQLNSFSGQSLWFIERKPSTSLHQRPHTQIFRLQYPKSSSSSRTHRWWMFAHNIFIMYCAYAIASCLLCLSRLLSEAFFVFVFVFVFSAALWEIWSRRKLLCSLLGHQTKITEKVLTLANSSRVFSRVSGFAEREENFFLFSDFSLHDENNNEKREKVQLSVGPWRESHSICASS